MPYLSDRFHDQQPAALDGTPSTGTFDAAAASARIRQRVLGQDEAVEELRRALVVAQAGFQDRTRPLAALMLVGPTGVGKTELVRQLAAELRGGPDDFCRVDMGQLAQEHYAAALSGAPPGYAGSRENSSVFDRAVVEGTTFNPGIVLFDEVEKAHAVVLRAMLGLLDRGVLTLANGEQKISFVNTFVFLTANLGSAAIARRRSRRWRRVLAAIPQASTLLAGRDQGTVDSAIRDFFDPEFLNRIDKIVHFNEISHQAAIHIVRLQLDDARARLARRGVEMTIADGVVAALVAAGFDPVYGARSLRRTLHHQVLVPAAELLVASRADGHTAIQLRLEPAGDGHAGVRVLPC